MEDNPPFINTGIEIKKPAICQNRRVYQNSVIFEKDV